MVREVLGVELKLTRLVVWAGRIKLEEKQADLIKKLENMELAEARREAQEKRGPVCLQACPYNL